MAASMAHAKCGLPDIHEHIERQKKIIFVGLDVATGNSHVTGLRSGIASVLGGHEAYTPAFYSTNIFIISILVGLCAGLITGCIGAGGGFIITPALMSAGVKGILAVGTDLFTYSRKLLWERPFIESWEMYQSLWQSHSWWAPA